MVIHVASGPHSLPWERQVEELRRIRALCPVEFERAPVEVPKLVDDPLQAKWSCVVCGARTNRVCSECGAVAYCTESHSRKDFEWHARACRGLREASEDASVLEDHPIDALSHELLEYRRASESQKFPHDWDDYLGDFGRERPSLRRVVCALASRPLTLAHAIRMASIEPRNGEFRIHVVAAAFREVRGPWPFYESLRDFWPGTRFRLTFVGPELPEADGQADPADAPMSRAFYRAVYRRALWDRIGVPDFVIGFNCGLFLYPTWQQTVLDLVGQGVPFAITSYREWEQAAEARLLASVGARTLLATAPNPFSSPSPDRSTTLVNDVAYDNAYLMAVR